MFEAFNENNLKYDAEKIKAKLKNKDEITFEDFEAIVELVKK